jgi:signal transduction histidine kinase
MKEADQAGRFSFFSWPVSVRAPLVVAVLMVLISAIVSNRVLARLQESQEHNLQQLAAAYLDGVTTSLIPAVVNDDPWEAFDILDRSRERYRGVNVQWVAVVNTDGQVIAASDPLRFPTFNRLPADVEALFKGGKEVTLDEPSAIARMSRPLTYQDIDIGRIYAAADIAGLMRERRDVFRELVVTNVLLTLFLVIVGYLSIRRMLRPVGMLSSYFARGSAGSIDPIPQDIMAKQSREFRRLFLRYNALAAALNEREALATQLAEEEKLASLGRLASGMAHEINNPLGGMFNALDSLRKYGAREAVRETSIRLLEHGLAGIRDLVRSTLATYRGDQRSRDLSAADLDDLRLLLKPEARQRKLNLDWQITIPSNARVPAVPVRDAVLNLLLNACHSSPQDGTVRFSATIGDSAFIAEISDEGSGLPPHIQEYIERKGAGTAPLSNAAGLGLWIVKRLCDEIGGELTVVRTGSTGTTIRLRVRQTDREQKRAA